MGNELLVFSIHAAKVVICILVISRPIGFVAERGRNHELIFETPKFRWRPDDCLASYISSRRESMT